MKATNLHSRLCSVKLLLQAWNFVKAKGSAGGIDDVSVKEFSPVAEKEINKLANDLVSGAYIPQPYKKVSLEKSNHEFRDLGLLCVRDKIVQQAMNMLLYPIIDKQLTHVCYAYRHEKGAVKAIKKVRHLIVQENNTFMVSCDLQKYFDNISHKKLFEMLEQLIADKRMLDLMALCVKMGRVQSGNRWEDITQGVPQGSIIAPLLANLFLSPLDNAITQNNFAYVRYADDFVVLTHSEQEAVKAIEVIKNIVYNSLNLAIKGEAVVMPVEKGFVFLGIRFVKDKISIDDAKKERLKEKLRMACQHPAANWFSILKNATNGIGAFYGKLFNENELLFLDDFIVNQVKERMLKQKTVFKDKTQYQLFVDKVSFITQKYEAEKYKLFQQQNKDEVVKKEDKKLKVSKLTIEERINKKKKEYQKLEAQGMELIVASYGAFVGKSQNQVMVKNKDKKPTKISLINLKHITFLSGGASISSDLIQHCAANQIPISFFSSKGQHYATLYNPFNTDVALWNHQMHIFDTLKAVKIASLFIDAKIRNQANLLKYFHKYHKTSDWGFAKLFKEKMGGIDKIRKEIKSKSFKTEDYRGQLMSIEGRSAAIYWELVTELINDDSDFRGRERQGAKDLVNALFNYGYAILYARVWEALLDAKLNPYISYLHVPNSSKPTLVFDFIEQFRQQAVDRVVIALLQKKEKLVITDGLLDADTRVKLSQNIFERLHRYETFRGLQKRFSEIITHQASAFSKYVLDDKLLYKPYIAKW